MNNTTTNNTTSVADAAMDESYLSMWILISIDAFNIVAHSMVAGIFLFWKVRIIGIQKIFLLSLSIAELTMCTLTLLTTVCYILEYTQLQIYGTRLLLVTIYGYYLHMVYVTIDRFLAIWLNIKYPLYFSPRAAIWLCLLTHSTLLLLGTVHCVYPLDKKYHHVLAIANLLFDILFVVCFLSTYGYIFYKIFARQVRPSVRPPNISKVEHTQISSINRVIPNDEFLLESANSLQTAVPQRSTPLKTAAPQKCKLRTKKQSNFFRRLFRSRFLVIGIMGFTFISFNIVPDAVSYFVNYMDKDMQLTEQASIALEYLWHLTYTSDALTYFFVENSIRRQLLKKIRGCLRNHQRDFV